MFNVFLVLVLPLALAALAFALLGLALLPLGEVRVEMTWEEGCTPSSPSVRIARTGVALAALALAHWRGEVRRAETRGLESLASMARDEAGRRQVALSRAEACLREEVAHGAASIKRRADRAEAEASARLPLALEDYGLF